MNYNRWAFCFLVVAGVPASSANANDDADVRQVWVANNGLDTPTCGASRKQACRSITFGIRNAQEGDVILVGPGRYGDLNADFQYTGPGDEAANLGLGCVVCIDKRVTILSTDGAGTTTIDPIPFELPPGTTRPPEIRWTVLINVQGVRLGADGQGFTIYGYSSLALLGEAGNAKIVGNVALDGGMRLFAPSGTLVVERNTIRSADINLQVNADAASRIAENYAEGGTVGFSINGEGRHTVARNAAVGNRFGFAATTGQYLFTGNTASATSFGFGVKDSGHRFRGNTAVGNDVGFHFEERVGSTGNSLHGNNMIGNRFCGFVNNTGTRVDATNNYWGSASGPGPKPADEVCNFPQGGAASTTIVEPFSPVPFRARHP